MQEALRHYARHGFPGCLSSGDGVHIPWDRCPASMTSGYYGKEKCPTIAYNVRVPHALSHSPTPCYPHACIHACSHAHMHSHSLMLVPKVNA
jgi:hypothetical protein